MFFRCKTNFTFCIVSTLYTYRYNTYITMPTGVYPRKPRTEETRRKISIAHMGKTLSKETCQKMSIGMKGRIPWNKGKKTPITEKQKEHLVRLHKKMKGRIKSEAECKQISERQKGVPKSEQHRRRISEVQRGRKLTEEWKQNIGKSNKGLKHYKSEFPYTHRCGLVESHIGGFWYGNIKYFDGPQYCDLWNDNLKNRVRCWYGYQCVDCGTLWLPGMKKFHVHHVWYNKKACCNDTPRSLVLLCDSCHPKTNTNRDYWSNYFQEMIDSYYSGKCWLTKDEMEKYSKV